MPRKPTLTERTNAEGHGCLKEVASALRQGVDLRTDRTHTVFVDDMALGERQGEMRKPNTNFYEKTFAEANAVAYMAINLDLDRKGRVDVYRLQPPKPDTELMLNRATVAFVEQTMVMDRDAHRLTLDVEEINATIRLCDDSKVRVMLNEGMLILRLRTIPSDFYANGLPIDEIVEEICALRSLAKIT